MNAIRPTRPLLLLAATCLGACQSDPAIEGRSVDELVRAGAFEEAVSVAEARASEAPDDAFAAEVLKMARVSLRMDEGRAAALAGDRVGALQVFFEVDDVVPGHPVVLDWIDKLTGELGELALDDAGHAYTDGELDLALLHYDRASVYLPGDPRIPEGRGRVLLRRNQREGLGEDYYRDGVRALREFWLGRAASSFGGAADRLADSAKAAERRDEVARLLAEDRMLMAEDFEQRGLWFAAANEYRLALVYVPDLEPAQRNLERCEREAAAVEALGRAEMARLRTDFEEADTALAEGVELTEAQGARFVEAQVTLDEARLEELYMQARDLESDGMLEEAITSYDELLQGAGFFKDALARRDTCASFVSMAERLYAEAEAAAGAQDADEERAKLEQISVFWPEYRDVAARLRAGE